MDARPVKRLALATLLTGLAVTVASCSNGNSGEPTVRAASPEESTNAPLVPSPPASSYSAPVKRGAVPIVPRTVSPLPGQLAPRLGSGRAPQLPSAAPPPLPDDVASCTTAQLKIHAVHRSAATGLLVFTNTATQPCGLSGWPTVALVLDDTKAAMSTVNVNAPNAPVGMALRPGRSAFAGLRWKSCVATSPGCHLGNALLVGAPNAKPTRVKPTGFLGNQLTMSLLEIGSIQPTTTNIVNW